MQVPQLMFSQLQSTLYLHQEFVTCATQPHLMSDYIQYKVGTFLHSSLKKLRGSDK